MLNQIVDPALIRKREVIIRGEDNHIYLNDRTLVNFASNDYLGVAAHDSVKNAFIDGVQKYGLGSASSALLSGYTTPHQILEEKFAVFLQREKCLLYNSGYAANTGVLSALIRRDDQIIVDRLCHASIYDGIRLTQASFSRYAHNDVEHLSELVLKNKQSKIVVTESVFSMEGDISPVNNIAQIAAANNAYLIVDDAHGMGVIGENGRGVCEYFNLSAENVPCLVVPLGKVFGSMGAVVAGNHALIEHLLQFSRTYRYTTMLPPAIASATIAALDIVITEHWRRKKLRSLITLFNKTAIQYGLQLISTDNTPIRSLLFSNNELVLKMQEALIQRGYYVPGIRPPTVPKGSARLRVSLNCMHREREIESVLHIIAELHAKSS